jgi:hypothetical protein
VTYASDYNPSNSFADDETNEASGRSTVRTVELDNQFADIAAAHNELNSNLKKLQRDDDKLRDFIVEPRTLSEQLRAMLVVAGKIILGEWKPNTIYLTGVLVQRNNIAYICQTAHNSGPTFNLGFWIAVSGDGQAQAWAEQAEISRLAAVDAADTASTSALTASVAASEAAASKIAAASSQLAAQNAADSIAGLSPVNLSSYMLGFLGGGSAATALASLGAVATADLVSGFNDQIRAQRFGTIGPVSPYTLASFQINKTAVAHAHYGILDSTIYDFTGNTQPLIGSASYNDNSTTTGANPTTAGSIDHHYSFQAYHHVSMNVGGVLAQYSALFSQLEITSGSVTTANLAWLNNPLGSGTVGTLTGVRVENLTKGSTNWGIFCKTAQSFLGTTVRFGNVDGTAYTSIGYDTTLGHMTLTPRAGYGVRIQGAAGDRKLRIGAPGGGPGSDADDSIIEQLGDGRTAITPRPGYGIVLQGTTEVTGGLILSTPLVMRAYTVATLPPAASWSNGRCMVTDATTGVFGGAVSGGGTLRAPVYSDGTTWRLG